MFIVCYVAMFKGVGTATNHLVNNDQHNILQLIETAVFLKKEDIPTEFTVNYGSKKKSIRFIVPIDTYLHTTHYLRALIKFLNLNPENEQIKLVLDDKTTLEQLISSKSSLSHLPIREKSVKKSVLFMLRDYLEEQLLIDRRIGTQISAMQVEALYPILEFLGWEKKFEGYHSYDALRNKLNRLLKGL